MRLGVTGVNKDSQRGEIPAASVMADVGGRSIRPHIWVTLTSVDGDTHDKGIDAAENCWNQEGCREGSVRIVSTREVTAAGGELIGLHERGKDGR
jgi:hypothetical protein